MVRTNAFRAILTLTVVAPATTLDAQRLHTNDRWSECAIVLNPNLTQQSWRRFAREVGVVTYFRPMASARPMGRNEFEVGVVSWRTRIDATSDAWNDTFSHPDETHYLTDGASLPIPGLMARAGLTDRVDVGAYFTKTPDSNYGMVGGQLQYNLIDDQERQFAAAGRVSAVRLFGPDDMTATTYGVDFLVSKDVSRFTPYAGVSGYLVRAHETSPNVNLRDENVWGAQRMVGVSARVSGIRLGAEYSVANVSGLSLKVAFNP